MLSNTPSRKQSHYQTLFLPFLFIAVVVFMLFAAAPNSYASQVTFAWDPSPSTGVVGLQALLRDV